MYNSTEEGKDMSNAIEIEAKALVTEKDYKKLASAYEKDYPAYVQKNYYIDNKDGLLRKEGIALRIRTKGPSIEMTLKTPLSEGLLEKNEQLTKETFNSFRKDGVFPDNDLKRFLTMLDIDTGTLYIKASLTTTRIDVPYEGGKLSIDKNEYAGKTDYEIELEYNNEADAERLLRELLEKRHIPFTLNKKTKVARALEEADRQEAA
jgi:uncharacterized protein YjbK